jgi:hypothetical protein
MPLEFPQGPIIFCESGQHTPLALFHGYSFACFGEGCTQEPHEGQVPGDHLPNLFSVFVDIPPPAEGILDYP